MLNPLIRYALTHSEDVKSRFLNLALFLEELKYLYLHFAEYDNGLSNKFSLESEARELKYSADHAEFEDKTLEGITRELLNDIAYLANYYVEALGLIVAMDIPNYDEETERLQKIFNNFKLLVAYQNGLGDAEIEEQNAFFALYGVPLKVAK